MSPRACLKVRGGLGGPWKGYGMNEQIEG